MELIKFSQFLKEEELAQVASPFDEVPEGTILRVMEPEGKDSNCSKPVYIRYDGRVFNWLNFYLIDDSYGNVFSDALTNKHFQRRNRYVMCDVNKIPSWLKSYTTMGNASEWNERKFQ